jgi:hypothetical protein
MTKMSIFGSNGLAACSKKIKRIVATKLRNRLACSARDIIGAQFIENAVIKCRQEDGNRKIAIFLVSWPLQSHTVSLSLSLVELGFNVDLFVYKTGRYNLINTGKLENNPKIKLYDLSYVYTHDDLPAACRQLLRGEYAYFIGVEKRGLILAGALAELVGVRCIYHSLELYVEDHFFYREWNLAELRVPEKRYHGKAVATIIQDRQRAEILYKHNGIAPETATTLYLPIAVSGPRNETPRRYFHNKFHLDASKKVLLYFGVITESRFCLRLAEISRELPDDMVLVFHGYFSNTPERKTFASHANPKMFFSEELVDSDTIPELIASATIGLVFYRNDYSNDRLTAFSSEKLALFMQSGIPIITFQNESYGALYSQFKCGEEIDDFSKLVVKARLIADNYGAYRKNAFLAYDAHYRFENNFAALQEFFARALTAAGAA